MKIRNWVIKRATENAGLRFVKQVVSEMWYSDFQGFDHENDDGIDGFINLRIKGVDTGGLVYVQVKSGNSYKKIIKKRPNFICLHLGENHICDHKERWLRKELPVILIYVKQNRKKTKAYWVDLRSEESYCSENKHIILIPKHQIFNSHSKGVLLKLSGVKSLHYYLPTINMSREEISFLGLSEPIKTGARK
ncbi:hypothetical protein Lmor_0095 [Legionella moravica]|uniref:DUF4365 domain-containing protein n=1 Tax=Legionella moravica TaxID=39962 RepID=A0A378JZ64_9GAMM|nr:DUF4365 domain-containing protein [Legionella moravica]KTD39444.1 hypothetical protein Lmor_0095 [Legionella moravica]STX63696.1 Uncharacterised protein [Legionella moravica]